MQGCFTATGENENATLKDKVAVMILGEWKRTVTKYQGCAWISKDQIEKCKTKRKWIREGQRQVSNSIRPKNFVSMISFLQVKVDINICYCVGDKCNSSPAFSSWLAPLLVLLNIME